MASLFRYNLCLISCGAPAGLAVYHYFVRKDQTENVAKKCCCNEGEESGCTGECEETCKKKEK